MKNSVQDQVTGIPTSYTKLYETLKRKLSQGARLVQGGGMNKVFRHLFSAKEDEKLLKVSQCSLSTTAGPIAGLLFISTVKVGFCSEKSLRFSSPSGELIRTFYKVIIPLRKIQRATENKNVNKPEQKYLEIVTEDNFDFWFLGFVNYRKAFNCVQQAISISLES